MKNLRLLLILISTGLIFSSCLREIFCEEGEGDRFTEVFIIDDFTGIELKESAEVTIKQGDEQKVEVTAHENILDRLQTTVNGGIWDINLGRDCYQNLELQIEITMPLIDEIHVSGDGVVEVGDFNGLDNVDVSVTGSGLLELGQFSGTKNLDAKISGSGEILGKGAFPNLERMNIDLSGSGNFDGFKIIADELDAKISGSGNLFVNVRDYIEVRITGSGDLHYKGVPRIDAKITGSGKIIDEN